MLTHAIYKHVVTLQHVFTNKMHIFVSDIQRRQHNYQHSVIRSKEGGRWQISIMQSRKQNDVCRRTGGQMEIRNTL
jgi:hypothetical protein